MRNNFSKKMGLALAFFAFIFGLNYFTNSGVQNVAHNLIGSMGASSRSSLGFTVSYIEGLMNINEMVEQNQQLRNESRLLIAAEASIQKLTEENDNLRKQLGSEISVGKRLLEVGILDVQRSPLSSTIIVDGGTSKGVSEGDQAIVSGDILIGVVEEVFATSAKVMLLDDPRAHISVKTLKSRVLSNTIGVLNGEISLDLITAQDNVIENELIVTSGLDSFDPFLVVGTIKSSTQRDDALFKKVIGQMLFDLSINQTIFIIR